MSKLEAGVVEPDMAMGAQEKHNKSSSNSTFVQCLDIVFCCLTIFLTGLFIYWSFLPGGIILFAWHPAFMSIGFILFMSQAISAYHYAMVLGKSGQAYSNRVLAHWVLNTIALKFIIGGFGVIVYNKFRAGKFHFQSTHAIFGLITYILMFLVAVGGIATKYSFQLRHRIRPVLLKVTHSLLGLLIYWLGGVTLVLGVYTNWFQGNRSAVDTYFSVAAIVSIWLYISWRPVRLALRRLRQMCTVI